jgi:hypothetical protein
VVATATERLNDSTFAPVLTPLTLAAAITVTITVATTPTEPDGAQLTPDGEATVVRTVDPADMLSVLATVTGAGDSLLDDELFAAALPALSDGVVMQVMAVDQPIGFDPVALGLTPEEVEQLLAEIVIVEPYEGLVVAELFDGEQSMTKVLLVYADTAAAESNSVVVEQATAEGVDPVTREPLADLLPGSDVSVIGSAVVIILPFEGAYPLAQRMLTQRSLFPSG